MPLPSLEAGAALKKLTANKAIAPMSALLSNNTLFKNLNRITRQGCLWLGMTSLLVATVVPTASIQPALAAPPPVSLSSDALIRDNGNMVTISVSNTPVQEILRTLSEAGGINILVDDNIEKSISLELNSVSVSDALSAITNLANLEIVPQGSDLYLVIPKDRAEEVGLNRRLTRIIPVQFGNAFQIASLLNSSLFALDNARLSQSGSGGGGNAANQAQKIKPDPRTNSLIIVGSQRDIDLTEAALAAIDKPRESKTFFLNYANAVDVTTQLMSSVFNDGTNGFMLGGGSSTSGAGGGGGAGGLGGGGGAGGGAGGGGGGGATQGQGASMQMPSTLRLETEQIEEGQGVNNLLTEGGSETSSFSQQVSLRGIVKQSETAMVSPMSVIVVPDTRMNSVTVMGTLEQIAMAEKVLPILDAEPPQVSIEVSLIEISEQGVKELSVNTGISDGKLQVGFNNEPLVGLGPTRGVATAANTGLIGLPTNDPADNTNSARSGLAFSTRPLVTSHDYLAQVNALITSARAKVLANPTVVATHDTEAIVSIVDQIIRRVNVSVNGLSGTTTIETEIGEAGIVLDILPKIGEDGTVSMRIRPSVTSVANIITDGNGNQTTLLTKRDLLAQMVRVKNGQTLLMGGLTRENSSLRKDKLPLLGDLPIVGALFRSSQTNNNKTELVMLLTPHILNTVQPSNVFSQNPLSSISSGY